MRRIPLFLSAIALLLTGCASKVVGLQKDPSFTYNALKGSSLVIGGVVDGANEKPAISNINSMNLLRGQIAEETEGLKISRSGLVRASVGSRTYKKMLQEYRDDSGLSPQSISTLSQKLKGKRYVIFSRLQKDEPYQNRGESQDTDKNGKKLSSKSINMVSGRNVGASVDVVDLHLKRVVWSGMINKKKENSQNYKYEKPKKDTSGFGGLINLVKTIKGTDNDPAAKEPDYKFPKTPTTQSVMASIFKGFAENLPEED